jgi:hypothetical protein
MGKNPMDYNKLQELGIKVLTVSLQSLGFTNSLSLYKDCPKSSCYLRMLCSLHERKFLIAQTKRELFNRN